MRELRRKFPHQQQLIINKFVGSKGYYVTIGVICMNITYLVPPGNIPSVIRDPGGWFGNAQLKGNDVQYYNANNEFWNVLFSDEIQDLMVANSFNVSLCNKVKEITSTISRLKTVNCIKTKKDFIEVVSELSEYIDLLNNLQCEINISLISPIHVKNLDYYDSKVLMDYCGKVTFLSKLVERSLRSIQHNIDLLLVQITSYEDLLTALIAVVFLRKINKNMHVCLADHGYENFSLSHFKDKFENSNTLSSIFDTIITYKEEKDSVINCLINNIELGKQFRGFIDMSRFDKKKSSFCNNYIFPYVNSFTKTPILSTRFNANGCYWSRCTFCSQNSKYKYINEQSNEHNSVVDRIEGFVKSGYKIIYFSDEAVHPNQIEEFSKAVIERGIELKWACRCRLESAFTKELISLMKKSGCYEILFGLESTSERVLKLMNKYPVTMKSETMKSIIKNVINEGIKVHITIIAGFPGEEICDLKQTVEFLIDTLRGHEDNAFWVNKFALFQGTSILKNSQAFNINPLPIKKDLSIEYSFNYVNSPYSRKNSLINLISTLEDTLYNEIGWVKYGSSKEVKLAMFLYYFSGFGAVMKSKGI